MKDRIFLAEAMGWTTFSEGELWLSPDPNNFSLRDSPPDPFTDANDCEALIRKLNEQGYEVDVLHWHEGDATVMLKRSIEAHGKHYRDEITIADWKQGVYELALKALRRDNELFRRQKQWVT